jgi:hypothetical protein
MGVLPGQKGTRAPRPPKKMSSPCLSPEADALQGQLVCGGSEVAACRYFGMQTANRKNIVRECADELVYKMLAIERGTFMLTRRALVLSGLFATFATAHAEPPAGGEPVAIMTAIYTRAAKGKGTDGGEFVYENKAAKAKYLSKSLIVLWAKADAHTPKGDVGPIDFDPVSNSQEPDIKSFKVNAEKLEADKATIAVTLTSAEITRKPGDEVVRYDFVREAGGWKIDDIRGKSDGEPWSIRDMLTASLKG